MRNPDLQVKVCELPGVLKDAQHLGRTRIWKENSRERRLRGKEGIKVRNSACSRDQSVGLQWKVQVQEQEGTGSAAGADLPGAGQSS